MNYTEEHLSTLTSRELDALIAEHLFGYQWARVADTGTRMLIPPDRIEELQRHALIVDPSLPLSEAAYHYVPPYGRSIAAAWEIAEVLKERTGAFAVRWESDHWEAGPVADYPNPYLRGDSAMQAIRLAALCIIMQAD